VAIHSYPKRLIEVDLPIKRISAHARREKSIRHGHISTLHIWWARRPLAACRAVICAALWPDPADPNCPAAFQDKALAEMRKWTDHKHQVLLSPESRERFEKARQKPALFKDAIQLRGALLDFIADFANWDNSTVREYLDASRALTQAAHEALGGAPGTRPLIVDPFAGGGAIPLEALRVGADAFASDLNPVAVLLNKVVLEYIPKCDQHLAEEVRKWGDWIRREAEKELAEFYPKDPDGATPIAYLWARSIQCEGPGCGVEVPLISSLWLANKVNRSVALQLVPRPKAKRVDFQIIVKQRGVWVDQGDPRIKIEDPKFDGTVKRGSATCPCCGYTTPVARVREQLKRRHGGARDASLTCVVTTHSKEQGRFYRTPRDRDWAAIRSATKELDRQIATHREQLSLVPNERLDIRGIRLNWCMLYGLETFGDLFFPRQALAVATLSRLVFKLLAIIPSNPSRTAVQTSLALCVDKVADLCNSLVRWEPVAQCPRQLFARQAMPLVWDTAEGVPIGDSSGSFEVMVDRFVHVLGEIGNDWSVGQIGLASATQHPLPDNSAHALITDPPYYDAIPYAYLSDFFYVWLRRMLRNSEVDLFKNDVVPKDTEIIVDRPHSLSNSHKDIIFYEQELTKAFAEGRRVVVPSGIGTIVFASKTTASWEAVLKAVIDAGWIITASWPIDTEMANKLAALGQARLMSSVHLVCRPRENPDGSARTDEVGDWRDVLAELPRRIHDWMPRLAEEGVVGADAIFACLGPALEIFSRYTRVEKASGETVALREYLEQVWAAVAKEALTMIFTEADATGFEEDARLTAIWLWTLKTGDANGAEGESAEDESGDDEERGGKKGGGGGFVLEFDAARKIAQGLGAHLEDLASLVAVEGETARLLPVAERAHALFGKGEGKASPVRRKRDPQMDLFKALQADDDTQASFGDTKVENVGNTVLDRVHQCMILFAAGRSEALKRFLVEDGAGRDARFWTLAQALSALYPASTDEKRWVDGVLARKKGLGF
jgi:adenine-specific DNA methylase